jgi:hypothetical protein
MESCTTVLPLITLIWLNRGYHKANYPVAYADGVPGTLICRTLVLDAFSHDCSPDVPKVLRS